MTRSPLATLGLALLVAALPAIAGAQAREVTTTGFDAQRTNWIRSDVRIDHDAIADGSFTFLWKHTFPGEPKQLQSLTQPVLQDFLVGYIGFKSLAVIGGANDQLFAIDTDLEQAGTGPTNLTYAAATGSVPGSTWRCPGGLAAAPSRWTPRAPTAFGGPGGGGGQRATSAVGEPGKGAAALTQTRRPRQQAPPSGDVPPPPRRPRPQRARRAVRRRRSALGGRQRRPAAHAAHHRWRPDRIRRCRSCRPTRARRRSSTSMASSTRPRRTAAATRPTPSGASTCWRRTRRWSSGRRAAPMSPVWAASRSGPAGSSTPPPARSHPRRACGSPRAARRRRATRTAVVALDRITLEAKDWFTRDKADFNTTPVVFRYKARDYLAVTANDGRLYLLDGATLGGGDHKTPLVRSPTRSRRPYRRPARHLARRGRHALGARARRRQHRRVQGDREGRQARRSKPAGSRATSPRRWRPSSSTASCSRRRAASIRGTEPNAVRGRAREALDARRALRTRRRDGQGAVVERHDDHVVRAGRAVRRRRTGLPRHLRQHALRLRHPPGALIMGHRFLMSAAFAAFALAAAPAAAHAQAQLPDGPGKAEVQKLCSTCHPADRGASVRLTREGWQDVMTRMVGLGLKGTDEELNAALEYLSTHFKGEAAAPLNLNRATPQQLAEHRRPAAQRVGRVHRAPDEDAVQVARRPEGRSPASTSARSRSGAIGWSASRRGLFCQETRSKVTVCACRLGEAVRPASVQARVRRSSRGGRGRCPGRCARSGLEPPALVLACRFRQPGAEQVFDLLERQHDGLRVAIFQIVEQQLVGAGLAPPLRRGRRRRALGAGNHVPAFQPLPHPSSLRHRSRLVERTFVTVSARLPAPWRRRAGRPAGAAVPAAGLPAEDVGDAQGHRRRGHRVPEPHRTPLARLDVAQEGAKSGSSSSGLARAGDTACRMPRPATSSRVHV